jgi:hypothetical protein
MRWVMCSFKPHVNRTKTGSVMAGEAYTKPRGSAQDAAWHEMRSSGGLRREISPGRCGVVVGLLRLQDGRDGTGVESARAQPYLITLLLVATGNHDPPSCDLESGEPGAQQKA